MLIYKYQAINDFFWDNLKNQQLWFANPIEFDDAFDSNLPLRFDYSSREVELFINKGTELFLGYSSKGDKVIRDMITTIQNDESERARFFKFTFSHHKNNSIGITCFSSCGLNTRLWAQYTNKNSGVCFGFDTEKDIVFFSSLTEVDYVKELPELKIDVDFIPKSIRKYYTTKSVDWEDQKELRLFRHKVCLDNYNVESLRTVIFGLRTPQEKRERIISMVLLKNPSVLFEEITMNGGKLEKVKYGVSKNAVLMF